MDVYTYVRVYKRDPGIRGGVPGGACCHGLQGLR